MGSGLSHIVCYFKTRSKVIAPCQYLYEMFISEIHLKWKQLNKITAVYEKLPKILSEKHKTNVKSQ